MELEPIIIKAVADMRAGKFADAAAIAHKIIGNFPTQSVGHHLHGDILAAAGKLNEAIASFDKAISLSPSLPRIHLSRANALRDADQLDLAIEAYGRARQLSPEDPDILLNLAIAYRLCQLPGSAHPLIVRALVLRPNDAESLYELALVYEQFGRREEAIEELLQAIENDPKMAKAFSKLGGLYVRLNKADEAIDACKKAIALNPKLPAALSNLAAAWELAGHPEWASESHRRAAVLAPNKPHLASSYLYSLYFHPNCPVKARMEEHKVWDRIYARPLGSLYYPHENGRDPDRALKIGYVGPHFRACAQAAFILPFLLYHDHRQFEIHLYHDSPEQDGVTTRMELCSDAFRETGRRVPTSLADQIRIDQIDILVGLTKHMPGSRLETFAARPAPVQITYLAYPGTSGISAMQYHITDPFLDPPGEHVDQYTENPLCLPTTFACYDPAGMDPRPGAFVEDLAIEDADPGPPPAQANGYITFGCFNRFRKINESILKRWSLALKALPDSRLRLLAPANASQRFVLDCLGAQRIDKSRIDFVKYQPRAKYLQEFRAVDLCLDTLPFNGHATTLDSLWMGTPVVTFVGPTAEGRIGWSIANNIQLPELAAHTDDDLVRIVTTAARDLSRLTELRRTLRRRLLNSPLMNAPALTLELEAFYRRTWQAWAAS